MRHVKLDVIKCEHTGELGFRPKMFSGWSSYIAGTSLGHDLIDHGTKEWGEVWQEFRALGAYLFVSQFGEYKESNFLNNSIGKSIFYDFTSTLSDLYSSPKLHSAPKVKLEGWEEDSFAELWEDFSECFVEGQDNDECGENAYFFENKDAILSWFRYGYKKAKDRYNGNSWNAWSMRNEISDFLRDKWEKNEFFEGDVATLSYSVKTGEINLKRQYDY
jgi:hypothetical protein